MTCGKIPIIPSLFFVNAACLHRLTGAMLLMPSLFSVHILPVFAAVLREWLQIERGEGMMHEAVKAVKPCAGEGERDRHGRAEGRARERPI